MPGMQWSKINFIPNGNSEKARKIRRDLSRLTEHNQQSIDRILMRQREKIQLIKKQEKAQYIHERQFWEEMACTIWNDPTLQVSSENPDYYPSVPRNFTPRIMWRDVLKKESFTSHGLFIVDETPLAEELEKIEDVFWFFMKRIFIQWADIDIITWFHETKNFRYPIVTSRIWYRVSLLVHPDGSSELVGIYILKRPATLKCILELLSELEVNNPDDLALARSSIIDTYFSITSK